MHRTVQVMQELCSNSSGQRERIRANMASPVGSLGWATGSSARAGNIKVDGDELGQRGGG